VTYLEPSNAADWVAVLSLGLALIAALVTGVWAVWVRARENTRQEWKRVQELAHIVYDGTGHGYWAQKLAVEELLTIKPRRRQVVSLLREAAAYFHRQTSLGAELARHIDDLLPPN
jgi:hypothetical protein